MEPITGVDHAYWTYAYDVRYRLTQAQQYNSSDQLLYTFNYTYDKAGNMLTKSEVIPQGGSYYFSYEYNDANELTKQTYPGITYFSYDAWGRMTSKTRGETESATYEYRYGDKLKSVTSNFSGEGNVTYEYGRRLAVASGDGKRRKRQDSSATTQYNWDAGWNVINEENGCGTLTMTYVHDPGRVIGTILADVDSDDPSSGTYRYYFQDNIGSTRRLRNDAKASLGSYEYTPYGQVYLQSGATIRYKFTGKEWDDDAKLYYFPYRCYSPSMARWITRDPLGLLSGPNLYPYVEGNPLVRVDPEGRLVSIIIIGAIVVGAIVVGGCSGQQPQEQSPLTIDDIVETIVNVAGYVLPVPTAIPGGQLGLTILIKKIEDKMWELDCSCALGDASHENYEKCERLAAALIYYGGTMPK